LDPCLTPLKLASHRPPDSLSGIGFVTTYMLLDSHIARVAQLSFEQQKYENVNGDSYILKRLLGSASHVLDVEEMCSIFQVDFLQGTCIQLAPSGILLFVPLLPVYWYCTLSGTTRKAMETAAHYYLSLQSEDPPRDIGCLVKICEIILASTGTHSLGSWL
jgi:hypothetical protein